METHTQVGASSAPASASVRIASFILRSVTFILLFISLIVLATTSVSIRSSDDDIAKVRFQDFYAYRYMLSALIIGTVCTISQLAFSIFNHVKRRDGMPFLDFFGDKLISYMLATGAAAGFGLAVDLKRLADAIGIDMMNFDDKTFASASLLLLAFITTAILSIISAFTLPKRV